ncbi:MAG: hypothetical protein WA705_21545 [Candidatus Ozemobacteraceae bacterium]
MKKHFLLVIVVFLTLWAVPARACDLPAEPCANVFPTGLDSSMCMPDSNGNNFWMVPENTAIEMSILWDPYDHNGAKDDNKYKGVTDLLKTPLAVNPDPKWDNKGFFPLSAMKDFFQVTGNRNSVSEAFGRSMGLTTAPDNTFIPAGISPTSFLMNPAGFLKGGGGVEIVSKDSASGFIDPSHFCNSNSANNIVGKKYLLPAEGADLNNDLPHPGQCEEEPVNASGTPAAPATKKIYEYVDGSTGMYIAVIAIGLTNVENSDYKAYVDIDSAKVPIICPSGTLPHLAAPGNNTGLGNDAGKFNVKFSVPTTGSPEKMVKLRVYCPPAGFTISNTFWAWQEKVTTQKEEYNASGTFLGWKIVGVPAVKHCSVGWVLTAQKPGAVSGYTAFMVYDSRPPISSKLELSAPATPGVLKTYVTGEAMTDFDFTLTMVDTNPYGNTNFTGAKAGGTYTQNAVANIKPDLYFSYPVYEFATETGIVPNDFTSAMVATKLNVGLLDFSSTTGPAQFTGQYYKVRWVWKKATVTNPTITFNKETVGGLDVGGTYIISGKATVPGLPAPWHVANAGANMSEDYNQHSSDYKKLGFKAFVVCRDSADNVWDAFQTLPTFINDFSNASVEATAKKEVTDSMPPSVEVSDPANVGTIWKQSLLPANKQFNNEPSELAAVVTAKTGNAGTDFVWQKYPYYKVEDKGKPEIQVIVFDTRNNSYHIFGSKNGGDALASSKANTPVSYDSITPGPFSAADSAVYNAEYQFTGKDLALFDSFFKTNGETGVNLMTTNKGKGLVCQRNTRLVFYIRAWDNINTFKVDKKNGVSNIEYTVTDETWSGSPTPPAYTGSYLPDDLMQNPPMWQFRASNTDGTMDNKVCLLDVTAKDPAGNSSNLKINVYVVGNELEIRSLEEKRNRSN